MRHCLRRASSILWHGHHLQRAGMKIRPRIERATPLSLFVPLALSRRDLPRHVLPRRSLAN